MLAIDTCTVRSAVCGGKTIWKRSLSPMQTERSTALATSFRSLSESLAGGAAAEKVVGTMRTVLAARIASLSTLTRAFVSMPSSGWSRSYEDNDPVCARGTVAHAEMSGSRTGRSHEVNLHVGVGANSLV